MERGAVSAFGQVYLEQLHMKGHDIKNVARRCRAAMTLAAMIAAVVLGTTESHAQWTVTYLHPPGAAESHASGTSGTQQAGSVRFPGGRGRAVCPPAPEPGGFVLGRPQPNRRYGLVGDQRDFGRESGRDGLCRGHNSGQPMERDRSVLG